MKRRIGFYCHQIRGLGHLAISTRLAEALSEHELMEPCVIGSSEIDSLRPNRIKTFWLPHAKEPLTAPNARATLTERSKLLIDFLREWSPAMLIVDTLALGLGWELVPVLEVARLEKWKTRFCLGVTFREGMPSAPRSNPEIRRAFETYRYALGYSDAGFEPVLENLSAYPNIKTKAYQGFVVPTVDSSAERASTSCQQVVVLCGGGFYGVQEIFDAAVTACRICSFGRNIELTFVAGVLAKQFHVPKDISGIAKVRVVQEGKAEHWAARADVVIARCGYSTAFTIIQSSAAIIFAPVKGMDGEQQNRAHTMSQKLERVWALSDITDPGQLARLLEVALESAALPRPLPFLFFDKSRLADLLLTWTEH